MSDLAAENKRLREALWAIIDLDHHNHGPESQATKIAREVLNEGDAEEHKDPGRDYAMNSYELWCEAGKP